MDYQEGVYVRTPYSLQGTETGATFTVGSREGSWTPPERTLILRVRRVDHGAVGVRRDGVDIPQVDTFEELIQLGEGWWYDADDLSLVVATPDGSDTTVDLDYDPSLSANAPPVTVSLRVEVPPGTPLNPPVHVALSSGGWAQQSLSWSTEEAGIAEGTIQVPRGAWVEYKYTRGDWAFVEKDSACEELPNRFLFGAGAPLVTDQVSHWIDDCSSEEQP
jgi:hypothetical protein